MARELFVDTSGFYALLAKRDSHHQAAKGLMRRFRTQRRRLITTDYVLDEAATLLKARGEVHLVELLFESVAKSAACRIEWTNESRFRAVERFFLKHADQAWSFTDCASFVLMKELRLREALTSDEHFEQAGFVALLR